MTGVLKFDTPHGPVYVEVEEDAARAAGGRAIDADGYVAKGGAGRDIIAEAPRSFDEAMGSLRAYASSLQDVVTSMAVAPSDVTVEIGLKVSGSVGFVLAKAGADTTLKVTLKWSQGDG